jgi:hypothetical protein
LIAGLTFRLLAVKRSVTLHTVQSLAFLHTVGKPAAAAAAAAAVSDFCGMSIKGVNEHPLSISLVHLWITCFLLANVMFCLLFR